MTPTSTISAFAGPDADLSPALPAAPRRNVTHIGRPSDIGADVLGHLIDTAARGYPGEWTARWTPGEVRIAAAADPRVHILLAPKGTSADVRIRAMSGAGASAAHLHLARALRDALALHERVNAEGVAGALAAGVEPARLLPAPGPAAPAPAPAPGREIVVSHVGKAGPLALVVESAIRASVPPERKPYWRGGQWSIAWTHSGAIVQALGDGGWFSIAHGRVQVPRVVRGDFETFLTADPEIVIVADAVRAALAAHGAQEAA